MWNKMFYIMVFVSLSCGNTDPEKIIQLRELIRHEKDNLCAMAALRDSISTQWDGISDELEQLLPQDMPKGEKNNMLKSRNAHFLRMFKRYKDLDDNFKRYLSSVETLDMNIAKQLIFLKKEIDSIETLKLKVYQDVEQKLGKKRYKEIRKHNDELLLQACQ